jgi:predicted ribosome quality control (RQC) complex YloA/Tae2 family protein
LSVCFDGGKVADYLVVIVEGPGPFCYLSTDAPLATIEAPFYFRPLAGAVVVDVERPANERILRLVAESTGVTGGTLWLNLLLFGSTGRVELLRDGDAVMQFVGSRRGAQRAKPAQRDAPPDTPPRDKNVMPTDSPLYLISRGRLGRVAPSAADDPMAKHHMGPFADAAEACRDAGGRLLAEAHHLIVQTRLKPVLRRAATQRRLLSKLEGELERAADHRRLRREAETLAAYQTRIVPGTGSIELPDVYNPEATVHIELDPAAPVRKQIEKRFKQAARLERSIVHTRRRIEEVGRQIVVLQSGISAVECETDFAGAMNCLDRLLLDLPGPRAVGTPTGPGRGDRADIAPYRQFDLDPMWFVLVGRNNRENDQLTFHTATPTDLWFHAHRVPGSHVVLKSRGMTGSPPAEILERAACVAAYYSKAKHSGLVPVIYTQRKYVRKPRGAKPGQVVCEREKMIMVEPVLPTAKP